MSVGWLKTKRGIARRAFLGGAGTMVSLPILESLLPRGARAAATSPTRLIYYYVPDGIVMNQWKPTTAGPNYTMTPILTPIANFKNDFMVLTGTRNDPARPNPAPGDHAAGTSGFITCATALHSATEIKLGVSVDQLAAKQMTTLVPSMALGIDDGAQAGTCDSGYGCPYVRAISWSDAMTPAAKITNPVTAFNQLFKGFDPTASQGDLLRRQKYQKSVLDAVTSQANSLKARLGTTDKQKLDEYFTSVAETEREVTMLGGAQMCNTGMPPDASVSMDFEKKMNAMADIMTLAFQCDVTRVFTFMVGNAGGQRVYSNLGITRGHHDISHHGGQAVNLMQLTTIDTYEVKLFGYLLNKLKTTMDGTNDLLYNSTIYFSSEISDGDAHNHDDMPVLIAGHGGGMLKTGQHYMLPTTTKVSNVLLTTLRTMGINNVSIGDSTGPQMDIVTA